MKSQALLALLATAPGYRRSRVWLADKLWSDRDAERADGSLRQALSEIRRTLGGAAGTLCADRRNVWLAAQTVVDIDGDDGTFLEGIDVRDPEWEDWLRIQRSRFEKGDGEEGADEADNGPPVPPESGPALATPPVLSVSVEKSASDEGRYLAGVVSEMLAHNLSETMGLQVGLAEGLRSPLNLLVAPHVDPDGMSVSMSLRRAGDGAQLWAGRRIVASPRVLRGEDFNLHSLLSEAQDAALVHQSALLLRQRAVDTPMARTQILARRIFAFDAGDLREIEAELEAICRDEPNAVTLGWLLFVNRIMFFECVVTPTDEWRERMALRTRQAVALGSTNSFTLAAVSGSYMRILGHPHEANEVARRAVRLNPSNPFAIDALASAMYLMGRTEDGYRLALTARNLTLNTTCSHFFDMSFCLASILTNRKEQALSLASIAAGLSPNFRAALRHQIALLAHSGNLEEAAAIATRLAQVETDFTVDRLVNDPSYPVGVLRTAGLGGGRLGELI